MSKTKEDLIKFRLERAEETLDVAKNSIQKNYFNSAASNLYYTCFYLVKALFAQNDIKSSTQTGTQRLFGLHFIKQNKIDAKWGKLFNTLFEKRQEGDYGDFLIIKKEEINLLIKEVVEFETLIKNYLKSVE